MISKGDFIKLSYTAKLEDGTVVDTTNEETAREYGIYNEGTKYGDIYVIVGERHVVEGLDDDLEGKEVGYKGEVLVPPEKAFGSYDPDKKEVLSLSKFREKPRIGQRVRIGNRVGLVERIIGRRAIVDFNHPLAGKSILFEYEIKERIEKPEDKIKAIFLIHSGLEVLNVKVEDNKAVIEVPNRAYFNQVFILSRFRIVDDIFKHLKLDEVRIFERFKREKEKEVKEPEEGSEEAKEGEREEKGEGEEKEEGEKVET